MSRNKITPRLVFHYSCILLVLGFIVTMEVSNEEVITSNNKFGLDLFKIVANDNENKLISPFSAHVVLSMAYQGASGETLKNFAQVFNLPDPAQTADQYYGVVNDLTKVENVTLNIANKIYIKQNFHLNKHFHDIITTKFLSEAEEIEFSNTVQAASEINKWVTEKTNNKIKELIKPNMLDSMTRLVLLNAVYFKGNWSKKFDVSATSKKPFHLLSGDKIQVDMMHKSAKFLYSEDEDLNCKILELPYEGNELSMMIFLPNNKNGITELLRKLPAINLTSTLGKLSQYTVNVQLPKFKIESTIPLKQALIAMGAENMFTHNADFRNMAAQPLQVSDVIQKTFIEVNEEGAEAAAATGMIMMMRCMPMPVREAAFIAEHPFMFALVHRASGQENVLFFGQVVQP